MPTLDRSLFRDCCDWGRASDVTESVTAPASYRRHADPVSARQRSSEWFRGPRLKSKVWIVYDSKEKQLVGEWISRSSGEKRSAVTRTPINLQQAIVSSRWILDLKKDWDEQGALPYAETTWKRACDFLIRQSNFSRHTCHKELPVPKILPGPNASIDLHWKLAQFELLVNVPNDPVKNATFYGDDYGDLRIRGDLNTAEVIPGLVVWLLH